MHTVVPGGTVCRTPSVRMNGLDRISDRVYKCDLIVIYGDIV